MPRPHTPGSGRRDAEHHTLKREVGDWDEAEKEALAAIERAEPAPVS